MKQKQLILIGGGALLVGLLALVGYLLFADSDPYARQFRELRDQTPQVPAVDESVLASIQYEDVGEGGRRRIGDLTFEQIVALLRQRYGANINNRYVQVDMLDELMRYLKKEYPEQWVQKLQEILFAAFPDQASALFRLSEQMYQYQKQMEDSREKLASMEAEERSAFLWDLRRGVFGDEAAREIWASVERRESVQTALRDIAANKDMPVTQKVEAYAETIRNAYGDQTGAFLERRRQELTNQFFESVHGDLSAMEPEERRDTYRYIWKEMGYDAAAVDRLDALEDERDQAWSNGALYMAERKKIASEYSGSDREAKLDELRQRLFGEEAETIKNEEAAGFFRFDRSRRFGRD